LTETPVINPDGSLALKASWDDVLHSGHDLPFPTPRRYVRKAAKT
jgi:hypothetical protein